MPTCDAGTPAKAGTSASRQGRMSSDVLEPAFVTGPIAQRGGRVPLPLIKSIARKAALWKAWSQVKTGSSPFSYGPDNITLREFGAASHEHLRRVGKQLLSGTFRF